MTERHRLSSIVMAVVLLSAAFVGYRGLARDERGHQDRCPTISKTKAERHKPSYRFVPPLDARGLPALN
jgi:hypothetical protein